MSPGWLALLLVPAGVFALAWRHPGFRHQPGLVTARRPDVLAERVGAAGGARVVRAGVLVDTAFVLVTLVVLGGLLLAAGGPWWPAALAAALDTAENLALLTRLQRPDRWAAVLPALGIAKLLAYAAALVAVLAVTL